ncbi:Spore protein SP21 [subsurface metagenome]
MSMMRWQPFSELMSLRQAMDKLFEDSFVTPSRLLSTFGPGIATPIDMYHTANDVVVKATLPGVKPEEVDITITGDNLTIKGETKAEEEVKREDYLYQEHRYSASSRSVTLPSGLNTDKAAASFDNGILTLTIPKSERVKPKSIKVKAKGIIEGKK